jgi:hypothetical protein
MLNCLEAFLPPAVSYLGVSSSPVSMPKLLIQLLNVSDLLSETPNFVPKNP